MCRIISKFAHISNTPSQIDFVWETREKTITTERKPLVIKSRHELTHLNDTKLILNISILIPPKNAAKKWTKIH